ncbi:fatty-acid--CoA ligase FadD5 [Segniliparus rugosus]|uniref:fatty-acid--CoA ligase FadD5 n=1 Tax=Segniliparus rugosus TaxID=286804 RepID=UPI00058D0D7A|nr:fatty-acid--CoA ligase FadD5 [Segniliparus rugosus]
MSACRNTWAASVVRHAQMRPDLPAIRFQGRTTTWAELEDRTSRLAGFLRERGVGFGDRVLVLMLNRPEYVETALALGRLGAIAVPVNFRLAPGEVVFIARDCGARAVVTDEALAPLAQAVTAQVPELALAIGVGVEADGGLAPYATAVAGDRLGAERATPDDAPALIMYTSGTTGRPKGAVLTHANLHGQTLTAICAFHLRPEEEIAFVAAPMFHIAGLGSIGPDLVLGFPTVIHPTGGFDPAQVLDALAAERVTTTFFVPTQWQALCAEQRARPRPLNLRIISWGAAPASDALLREMAEVFPDADNVAVFGQTEMSPVTCLLDGKDAIRKLGSVGRVIRTLAARVVDDEMREVPQGEVGEIVYRGPTMMREYWNNPEATAEAFAGGWFHSGDLVRMDEEGFVFVVDRKKDMIISGGENIYCVEVENALCGHPAVAEAAVVGRAHEKWGETVVAVLALAPGCGEAPTAEELSAWLEDKLARYKHPKDVVVVPALPRNASGKVVKAELRAQLG